MADEAPPRSAWRPSGAAPLFSLLLLITLLLPAASLSAQHRQPDTVFSVDVDWIGAAMSYARETGPGRYWGLGAGVGSGFWNRMLFAGRHFADENGLSYEPRDGATDKDLIEIIHVEIFRRWVPSSRWSYDLGLRAAAMAHFDSSDDDPGVPLFFGGYANVMVGNDRFKVGPHVLVGLFTEGSRAQEFGVFLVPLSGRVSFGW